MTWYTIHVAVHMPATVFVSNLHYFQVLLNERRLLRGVREELHEGDAVVIEGSVGQRFSYHLVQSTESAMRETKRQKQSGPTCSGNPASSISCGDGQAIWQWKSNLSKPDTAEDAWKAYCREDQNKILEVPRLPPKKKDRKSNIDYIQCERLRPTDEVGQAKTLLIVFSFIFCLLPPVSLSRHFLPIGRKST
jgi:hypothetical protein